MTVDMEPVSSKCMHSPEALILRRCYPVPVTFADLRASYVHAFEGDMSCRAEMERQIHRSERRPNAAKNERTTMRWIHAEWQSGLKKATSALDEVYAVVDGREVRVAILHSATTFSAEVDAGQSSYIADLLEQADRAGYWERPHEVRLDLQERAITLSQVKRAVMVGQQHAERSATKGGA